MMSSQSSASNGAGDSVARAMLDGDDESLAAIEHTLSEHDQNHADTDQTASDADDIAAETDQAAADTDQIASDRDQAAADREEEDTSQSSASEQAYDLSREERDTAAAERGASAAARTAAAVTRTQAAARRDETGRLRDTNAALRDRVAEARDRAAERKEASPLTGMGHDEATAAMRNFAATIRERAAADRKRAAEDRARAAADRTRAAEDRAQARAALQRAYIDELTGVYTRGLGLLTLQHEIDRAHRTGEPFVLAFVDVDGLKQVNDSHGHAAGDAALRRIGQTLRSNLRSYDPIVRVGGDEFICAFSNTSMPAASHRLEQIAVALDQAGVNSISVGLAELSPTESLEDLIARGDAELYRAKEAR